MSSTHECVACGSPETSVALEMDGSPLYRCAACKTLHFPEVRREADSASYHRSETAESYGKYYDALRAFQASVILGKLASVAAPPASLLDVGCGNGVFVRAALQSGYAAEGVDISLPPEAHQHAAGSLAKKSIFEVQEMHAQYDVVTVLNVLEHVSEPRRFLQTVARIVKPGGWVVFALPLSTGLVYRVCRLLFVLSFGLVSGPWRTILQWHLPSPHVFLPSLRGLRVLMSSSFGSPMQSVSTQVIVDGSRIGQRVDLERAQRRVGLLEALALYAAGSVFSTISTLASRLKCPDEVFFFVKNENAEN